MTLPERLCQRCQVVDLNWRWWDPIHFNRRFCDPCAYQRKVEDVRARGGWRKSTRKRPVGYSQGAFNHRARVKVNNRQRIEREQARRRAAITEPPGPGKSRMGLRVRPATGGAVVMAARRPFAKTPAPAAAWPQTGRRGGPTEGPGNADRS